MVLVMDAQPAPTQDEMMSQLRRQLVDAENRFAHLQQEKMQMESDFEYKRSKIKELYYAKENTIREQSTKLFEASKQISQLEATVNSLQEEIENVKMIASVSENTKQEAVEDVRKHHQEEIESLKCVLQDTFEEQRRELLSQFEQERRRWEQEKDKLELDNSYFKKLLTEAEDSLKAKEKELATQADQELETSMMKAQSEAENLKSVVLPLEQEITELKEKLRIAEEDVERLREAPPPVNEKQAHQAEAQDVESSLNEIKELKDSLQSEKSSRNDLEQYVDVLSREQQVLQQENDVLKREMHEVCRSLEQEQSDHSMLKQTWNRANEHFMIAQEQLMNELNAAKACLTFEQFNRFKTMKRVVSKDGFEVVQTSHASKTNDFSMPNGSTAPDSTLTDSNSFGSFQGHQPVLEIPQSPMRDAASTPATELHDTVSISSVASYPESGSLTQHDVERPPRVNSAPSLNHMGNEEVAQQLQYPEESVASPTRHLKLLRMKETEIETLKHKIKTQEDEVGELRKLLTDEQQTRKDVEESVMQSSEEARRQIKELTTKIHDIEEKLEDDRLYRKNKEAEDNDKLLTIATDRERIRESYVKLKKEQTAMKSSFERSKNSIQRDASNPNTMEGLRISLDRYKEAYAIIQVEKTHSESVLQNRLSLLESSLDAEKTAKDQMEAALSHDLEEARRKISSLQSLQDQMIRESNLNKELKIQVEKDQLSMDSIRSKSRDIIKSLKDKLRSESSEKEALEVKLADAKNQLRSLQESLETSELVQRDFVKLSQSLQVQLEEIRLKEEASSSKASKPTSEQSPSPGATPNKRPE